MASNAKRRHVLDPNARPCLWCPRTGSERGGIGRRAKGIGSRVLSKGTPSPNPFIEGTVVMLDKWTTLAMASVAYFLQQGSLLVALSQLSVTRCVTSRLRVVDFSDTAESSVVMFSHFSSAWAKTLNSATLVGVTFHHFPFQRYSPACRRCVLRR
jgi:hypothetical protein